MYKKLALAACAILIAVAGLGQETYTFTRFAGAPSFTDLFDGLGPTVRIHRSQIAADRHGNVYIGYIWTVRKITPSGLSTTLAGLYETSEFVDGRGENARFNYVSQIVSDANGTLYVIDHDADMHFRIRKITPYGIVTTTTAVEMSGARLAGADTDGNVYFVVGPSVLKVMDRNGAITTVIDLQRNVVSLTRDRHGAFYFATADAIYKMDAGIVTFIAQGRATALAVDDHGAVYITNDEYGGCCAIQKIDQNGAVTDWAGKTGTSGFSDGKGTSARFGRIGGLAVDENGNVYASQEWSLRKITPQADVSTPIGGPDQEGATDADSATARFKYPMGIARESGGTFYVSDMKNHTIRQVSASGSVTTFAGLAGVAGFKDGPVGDARFNEPSGIAVDGSGAVYVADSKNNAVRKISGGVVSTLGTFDKPRGIAVDASSGNVYVSEFSAHRIMKMSAGGAVTALAGQYYSYGGEDGQGANARFNHPGGLAIDQDGDVLVADTYGTTIRKVTPDGTVSTILGSYVPNTEQSGTCNWVDGPAALAKFCAPQAVAVDAAGRLYVVDGMPFPLGILIRRVAQGTVETIGGRRGISGWTDGSGSEATFCEANGIASDPLGNIWIADSVNDAIRVGRPTIPDAATVDVSSGEIGTVRQLGTSPQTATSWEWRLIRRPAGSSADLSSPNIENPTFTPDVAGLFTFQLTALTDNGMSLSRVDVMAVPLGSTTTLVASSTTSHRGQPVTLTATVSNATEGQVAFTEGTSILSRAPVVAGSAVWTTTTLTPGDHVITAKFEGDYRADPSSAPPITHSVHVLTALALTSSPNPAAVGQSVGFTAILDSACTGTVQFRDGVAELGAPVPIVGGIAAYATGALIAGTHAVTARFAGSTFCSAAESDPLLQVVSSSTPSTADLAITITPSSSFTAMNQPLEFTIVVTNAGSMTATGVTVTNTIAANVTVASATSTQGSCSGSSPVVCSVGTLATGVSATIVVRGTPTAPGSLSSTAIVTLNETDINLANNTATAILPVNAPAMRGWVLMLLAVILAIAGAFAMRSSS